jgi:hypothetical protein
VLLEVAEGPEAGVLIRAGTPDQACFDPLPLRTAANPDDPLSDAEFCSKDRATSPTKAANRDRGRAN